MKSIPIGTLTAGAVLSVALLIASTARAEAQRPKVGVTFELRQDLYRQSFSEAEREEIKRRAAEGFAEILEDGLPFIDFVTEGPMDDTLEVLLGRRQDDPAGCGRSTCAVHFHVKLRSRSLRGAARPTPLEFRSAVHSLDSAGTQEAFLAEMMSRFRLKLDEQHRDLIEASFSQYPLAREAFLMRNREFWVLPFSKARMRASNGSVVEIKTKFLDEGDFPLEPSFRASVAQESPDAHPDLPADYGKKLMARLIEPVPADLEAARKASELEVLGIYLLTYLRLPPPPPEPVPSELTFEGATP